jgi:hypothetical protein
MRPSRHHLHRHGLRSAMRTTFSHGLDPKRSVVNVGFTAGRTTAPYGIASLGRPRNNQWHISKLSGWYKSLYRSHQGPLCKKDDVQKTFHQGFLLPRFPD